jgi:CheY-like chemotaxis protein
MPDPVSGPRQHSAADPRPQFRVAAFGLATKFERLLQIVVRHARYNQYRFVLAGARGPGDYDVALVDMTVKGGPEVASTLRGLPDVRPVVTVGRRGDPTRVRDDLLQQSFTINLLDTLNRAVERHLLKPVARAAADLIASLGGSADSVAGEAAGRRVRALLVDPSPTARRQLALALGPMGIEVDGVGTALEALDVLALRRYGLLIAEVSLPDQDGLKLARRIKRDAELRTMPVIMLTARSSALDLIRGALSGCDCYLVKPVTMPTLRQSVVRCLRRTAARASGGASPAAAAVGVTA